MLQIIAPQLGVDVTDMKNPEPIADTLSSHDFLSPSPSFGFSQSLDELTTPDDIYAAQESLSFVQGLTSVNYDIDLSDLSADNSYAEDTPVSLPLEAKPEEEGMPSLLDTTESPTEVLLPSPIKPVCSGEYQGFAAQGWQIPSIPCETGDKKETSQVSGKKNMDDILVSALSGFMATFDNLF